MIVTKIVVAILCLAAICFSGLLAFLWGTSPMKRRDWPLLAGIAALMLLVFLLSREVFA